MKKITSLFIGVFLLSWLPSIASTAEITYYHTDALGTPMAMTDSTGKVVWRGDYYPFGEEYLIEQTPVKNKRHFTGKEKDEESGLHYFGARYMDEASGRFISPDPVTFVNPESSATNTALLGNPLRLNRYVYGLNNPHRYIDPDGNFPHDLNNPHNPYNLEDTGARYGGGSYNGKSFAKGLWGKITGKEATSSSARREVMRQQAIPTSQQPTTQSRNMSGRSYEYEVPKPGGGTQIKSVQQQTMDQSHLGQGHWEAGSVKIDPISGQIRSNQYGRPKLTNDKSKVNYDE